MTQRLRKGDKVTYMGGMNSSQLEIAETYTIEKCTHDYTRCGTTCTLLLKEFPTHEYHSKYFSIIKEIKHDDALDKEIKLKCDDSFKKLEQCGYLCDFDKVILEKDGHVTVYLKGCKVDNLTSVKYSASLDEISELEMKVRG